MYLKMIIQLIIPIFMLIWILFWVIKGFITVKKATKALEGSVEVECSECKNVFRASVADIIGTSSLQKEVRINTPHKHYNKVEKMCPCPYCGKVQWVKVNMAELTSITRPVALPIYIKHFAIAFIPPFIVVKISQLFL